MTDAALLEIRKLYANSAESVSALLERQAAEYAQYFTPFAYDYHTVQRQLRDAKQDIFGGAFVDSRLAALWLLRGWDQGYDVPTFGIMVDANWTGKGIAAACMQAAIATARLRGAKRIMSKVHTANPAPLRLNEQMGFVVTSTDGNILTMHKEL